MQQFTFRILLDRKGDEQIFRDIVINEDADFELLHDFILQSFGFVGGQMASFYLTDASWDKGEEIGLMNMGEEGSSFKLMTNTIIKDEVSTKGDKLLYVYDFLRMWCFYVELVAIAPISEQSRYPFLAQSIGKAPQETEKDLELDLDEFSADYENMNPDDEWDAFDSGSMENIDDLDM